MQWRMLQQEKPEDFVIATGRQESVRRFIELSAKRLGWNQSESGPAINWEGSGPRRSDEGQTQATLLCDDPRYFRPEVETLLGDPSKAQEKLGWSPTTTLEELVTEMIDHDREEARKLAHLKREGFQVIEERG